MAHNGYAVGVDLGTSNTVAVMRWPDGRTRPLLFDGQPILPSGVYLDEAGRLHVGRDAQRMAQLDPARYEPNPKRRIDEPTVLLGDRDGPTVGLLSVILKRVADKAVETCGLLPTVVLSHPAAWGASRRGILRDAAAQAGWSAVTLVPEPVAAARYFYGTLRHPVPDGGCLVVFDFGGGTLDVAVVRNAGDTFDVIGSGGAEDLGGLDIDAALVRHLGQLLATRHPEIWRRLLAPAGPNDRRDRRLFWDDVRGAKEMLSRTTMAPVPIPGVDQALHVTREELEQLARPLVDRAVAETVSVIEACRLGPGQLAGVFLVGGTSRMPLVAWMLHARLGVAPTALEQPELPVAEGALTEPAAVGSPVAVRAMSAVPAGVPAMAPASPEPATMLVSSSADSPSSPDPASVPAGPPGSGGSVDPPGSSGGDGHGVDSSPVPEGRPAPSASGVSPLAAGPPSRPGRPWYRRPWLYVAAGVAVTAVIASALLYYFGRTERPFSTLTSVAAVPLEGRHPIGADIEGDRAYLAAHDESGRLHLVTVDLITRKSRSVAAEVEETWQWFGGDPAGLVAYGETAGKRTLHVYDPVTLEQSYSTTVASGTWHFSVGRTLVWVDPDSRQLTWVDVAAQDETATIEYGAAFYRVHNWSDEAAPANLRGSRIQQGDYPDNRLVTISETGTLLVRDAQNRKERGSTTVDPIGSDDLGIAYQGLFLLAGTTDDVPGYQVKAYDLDKLGDPRVVYRDDREGVVPVRLTPCGEAYVCVLNSAKQLVLVDFKSDRKVWDKDLAEPDEVAAILPIGDRIMVNHQQGDAIYNVLIKTVGPGELVVKSKGWGAPVDDGSELRFDPSVASVSGGTASVATDVVSMRLVGVGAQSGEQTDIGAFDAIPSTCSWDSRFIACAGRSHFLVHSFRDE
ncbi:MAG TPA: Hsp70 family protein [Micromonosporaceae bacterium]